MRVLQILKFVTDTTDDEVLLTNFVAQIIGKRWFHSFRASISDEESSVTMEPMFSTTDPARNLTRENIEWRHAKLRTGPIQVIVNDENGVTISGGEQGNAVRTGSLTDNIIKIGQSHSSFPVRSTVDGTLTAYSQFIAIAKITAEELTRDACVLPVGHDVLRLLTNIVAATRGTTEHHGREFFLVSDARRWLLEFVLEATIRYKEADQHPLNRARFRSVEGGTIGSMSLVYPTDSNVIGEERRVFDAEKENRSLNSEIWRSRNFPLPWNRPWFGLNAVIDYVTLLNNGGALSDPFNQREELPCNAQCISAQGFLQEPSLPSVRRNNELEMKIDRTNNARRLDRGGIDEFNDRLGHTETQR